MRKTRLSVVCLEGLDNFLNWLPLLEEHYAIKTFIARNEGDVIQAIGYGDVIWCEWANQSAIAVTKHLEKSKNKNNKKVIVRLHSYEALSTLPDEMAWDYVHGLIYVADHIPAIMNTLHQGVDVNNRPHLKDKIWVIPNGVDIDDIKLNKKHGNGFQICNVGAISHKKKIL